MSKHILLKGSYNKDEEIEEVGIDEAGRGALAGPVTVAACIMPHNFQHPLIKDSKLLNEKERKLALEIVLDNAIAYQVEHVNVEDIENMNILRATLEGMKRCLSGLVKREKLFDFILVDGDQFHGFEGIPFETVVGGDNKYTSIAAASILAKTSRDLLMKELSEKEEFLIYGWNSNKGYGTKQHITAIREAGSNENHRHSFISHILTTSGELF
jgi:ribonuclease HII